MLRTCYPNVKSLLHLSHLDNWNAQEWGFLNLMCLVDIRPGTYLSIWMSTAARCAGRQNFSPTAQFVGDVRVEEA